MWKKLGITILILALVSLFTITPAEAGSKTRNQWQGAAIALGALALGGIVAHQIYANTPPPVAYYPPPPPHPEPYHYRHQPEYVPGHWETVREWVPGAWERVWVAGHYVERQTPGRYVERRAWMEGYYRNY